MDQLYNNITVVKLRAVCKRYFRMSKRETASRQNIYQALERQPEDVKNKVAAEAYDLIQGGFIRFARNTANVSQPYEDPDGRNTQRRRLDLPPEDTHAAPSENHGADTNPEITEGHQLETFMVAPDEQAIDDLLSEFVRATGTEALASHPCGACAQNTPAASIQTLDITNIPAPHCLAPDNPHPAHDIYTGMLLYPKAVSADGRSIDVCDRCLSYLKRELTPPLSLANDMWIGDVPYQLSNMSLAERTMIAKGFPSAFIVKLYPKQKGASSWGRDQFHNGLKGNVSTYQMDPAQLANIICPNVFPHPAKILSATIAVTFIGPKGLRESTLPNTFRVRRWKIRDALLWLKSNNPLYADIEISEEMLEQLPEDGIPEEIVTTAKYSSDIEALQKEHDGYVPEYTEETRPDDEEAREEEFLAEDMDVRPDPQVEPRTFPLQASGVVDIMGEDITYTEMMAHALSNGGEVENSHKSHDDFRIRRGSAFVNEYARIDPVTGERNDGGPSNPNHLLGAFPTLFPYGKGGFETGRTQKVPYQTHARWSLDYHDMRFRKDVQFPFQVFGVCQKREVCKHATIQMKKTQFISQMELISTIKPQDLIKASEEERRKVRFSNPAVRALRKNLTAIRTNVKGSDEARFNVRSKIWGMIIVFNPPNLWITINPSDTQDPIAQVIAGIDIDLDAFCDTVGPTSAQRASNVASDPFSSAKFFHFMIKTIIEVLFGITKSPKGLLARNTGIFGSVQGYIGTVEAQGRGTLHLHMMVWLTGAPTSGEMRRLLCEEPFRSRVAAYIKSVVKSDLDGMTTEELSSLQPSPSISYSRPMDPRFTSPDQQRDLERKLVRTLQLHSCSTRTCLKFSKGKYVCKRRAPFSTSVRDWINEQGEWGSKRTCALLNAWNRPIILSVRSNNDIKLITNGPLTAKLTLYVSSYTTKKQQNSSNVSALLAVDLAFHKKIEKRQTDLNAVNKRLIQRCANSLTKFREFSAPEVISYIMGWRDTFESHNFATIFWDPIIIALKNEFPSLTSQRTFAASALHTVEARSTVYANGTSLGLKDQLRDYRYRGIGLSSMSLLDFVLNTYEGLPPKGGRGTDALRAGAGRSVGRPPNVRHEYLSSANKGDSLRIVRSEGHETLPRFCGAWFTRSDKPNEIELHRAGMLALLTPWRTLAELKNVGETFERSYNAMIQSAGKRALGLIENAQYYHECLDGAREAERMPTNNPENGVIELTDCAVERIEADMEQDKPQEISEEDIERARLMRTKAKERLYGEAAIDEAMEHGVFQDEYDHHALDPVAPVASVEQLNLITKWDKQLQNFNRSDPRSTTGLDVPLEESAPSSTTESVSATDLGVDPRTIEHDTRPIPTAASNPDKPSRPKLHMLNKEQRRAHDIIEERLLQHLRGVAEQLLMLVLGPGGTGKTLLIGAITETFVFYCQEHILSKCATTGIAATSIGAQTLHSWAVLPVARPEEDDWVDKGSKEAQARRRKNISRKVFLIEDEVSMEDKALSYDASAAASKIKGEEGWEGSAFKPYGGMHVIKFGDFHQFPPVSNTTGALYVDRPEHDLRKAKLGRNIFLQFNTVVILEQQMRVTDELWADILGRVRIGQCSENDIAEIRQLVLGNAECEVPDFNTDPWREAILVTPRHAVREIWNDYSVRKHCAKSGIRRYTVPAEDFEKDVAEELSMEARLAIASMKDRQTGCLQDVIQIAVGMKTMVKTNYAVDADIANGTRGRIEAIILDQRDNVLDTDDNGDVRLKYPPALLLFRPDRPTDLIFDGIEPGLIPITPSTSSFKTKNQHSTFKIIRRQYALTPGYAFTDYKSQGQTIEFVIIDIGKPPTGSLSAFGIYVALSRSRGRKTIRLLRNFDEALFQHHPSEHLRKDMERISKLNQDTKETWELSRQ